MRLPNPLAVYRRWRFRRWCKDFGVSSDVADDLERMGVIGRTANEAGRKIAAVAYNLLAEGYEGDALLVEVERRIITASLTD
jgi:hypothetical protein